MKPLVLHTNETKARELLQSLGLDVDSFSYVSSRQTAHKRIVSEQPDTVLMDWWGFGASIVDLLFRVNPEAAVIVFANVPDYVLPEEYGEKAALAIIHQSRWQNLKPARRLTSCVT
ncbi:MAG: hypothetical protein KGJ93_04525 [Patescibacteria group bacterium]|nr:hypothetical protein [Patescibacteria group bacterium]